MTKYLIGALLALLIGTANADDKHNNGGTATATIGNVSGGTATATIGNVSGGNAFATGGAGGNATIQAGAVKVDNKNTNTNLNSNTNVNANTNINSNKQGQAQGQMQGQGQGQGQTQGQSNSAIGSGNSTNVTIEDKRQAVSPGSATAAGTTALCRVAGGFSVGGVWGGASIAGSIEDENCAAIEAAKAAIWAGASTGDASLVTRGTAVLSENLKRFEKKAEPVKAASTGTTEYGAGYAARTVTFESFTQ